MYVPVFAPEYKNLKLTLTLFILNATLYLKMLLYILQLQLVFS